jgi:hypothetical protein
MVLICAFFSSGILLILFLPSLILVLCFCLFFGGVFFKVNLVDTEITIHKIVVMCFCIENI